MRTTITLAVFGGMITTAMLASNAQGDIKPAETRGARRHMEAASADANPGTWKQGL